MPAGGSSDYVSYMGVRVYVCQLLPVGTLLRSGGKTVAVRSL